MWIPSFNSQWEVYASVYFFKYKISASAVLSQHLFCADKHHAVWYTETKLAIIGLVKKNVCALTVLMVMDAEGGNAPCNCQNMSRSTILWSSPPTCYTLSQFACFETSSVFVYFCSKGGCLSYLSAVPIQENKPL